MDTHLSPEQIFGLIVQVVVLLFAVSFHESAHALVALRCGDPTARDEGRITLNPLKHIDPLGSLFVPIVMAMSGGPIFGWAKPTPVNFRNMPNPRSGNLLVSGAGPISNLILAVVFAGVFALIPRGGPRDLVIPLLVVAQASVLVNLSLCLFNLLPVPPLDGFGVLESLLPQRFARVTIWLRRYGIVIFLVMIFTGVSSYVLNPAFRFLSQLLLRP